MTGRILATVTVAALAASCSPERPPKVAGAGEASLAVTVGGRTIPVEVWATERERRSMLYAVPRLDQGGAGLLLAWPRERYVKVESVSSPSSDDVAFLDRHGMIVEVAEIMRENPEGILSRAEAAYALLLPRGTLANVGAGKGAVVSFSAGVAALKPQDLPTMTIGGAVAHVELALTDSDRAHGLMFRPRMSEDDGMLFAYEGEGMRHFWMKNTLIPLDIAFFKSDGTLVNVNDTPMYPDPRHPPADYATSDSAADARFVLEMNRGWFKRKGLVDASGAAKPGVRALIPPEALKGRFD